MIGLWLPRRRGRGVAEGREPWFGDLEETWVFVVMSMIMSFTWSPLTA